MAYTVKDVSKLSGVSVRTLHYYDEIGLLPPAFTGENGYRHYEEEQLLRLQQIMFYRELDMPLGEIAQLLRGGPDDIIKSLHAHKQQLLEKAGRIQTLVHTIDHTVHYLKGEVSMKNEELFEGFDPVKQEQYEQEIVERYGEGSKALIEESKRRTRNWSKEDYVKTQQLVDNIHRELTSAIEAGALPDSPNVQAIIKKHYEWVNQFYTPTKEVYSGLGDLYVDHPDFRKLYDGYHPQLAQFLRDGMNIFADEQL
ncbi:MerR family transcriptional regulator [Paenibacillus sediminis]|uniref:DNA-binding transcriptional MerR regulator n=1 Tax=Paenibacillus sediminis TaxID=664909 RepID=A0ABS4H736_9BACL|nr:MerR family transcriptional regulator [Paenibacillus sediminis]MBP1938047.1 DNA-binding transcriptional MerR regulator [Paenibacillus sediminis]